MCGSEVYPNNPYPTEFTVQEYREIGGPRD